MNWPNLKCSCCGASYPATMRWQWWNLNGYYGISGLFCHKCFDSVSHDSYGTPNHPKKYAEILKRMKK